MADGASVNVSRWETSPHVGTHADAPLHVQRDGVGADQLPLKAFSGAAQVVDVSRSSATLLTLQALRDAGWQDGGERLVLRTGRSVVTGRWPEDWPALAADAASALVAAGLKLLAVDCPSVDPATSKELAVHHALFQGGAYVLENLDLRRVAAGSCELLALPLRTGAVDAAPVRALLRSTEAS